MRKHLSKLTAFMMTMLMIFNMAPAFAPAEGRDTETVSNVIQLLASRDGSEEGITWNLSEEPAKGWLTGKSFKVETEGGSVEVPTDTTKIPEYASFEFAFSYKTPANNDASFRGLTANDRITFPAAWIWNVKDAIMSAHNVFKDGGTEAGEWWIEDGQIGIQYYESYLSNQNGGYGMSTTIELKGMVDTTSTTYNEKQSFSIFDTTYSPVVVQRVGNSAKCNADMHKNLKEQLKSGDRNTGAIYTITVEAYKDNNKDIVDFNVLDEFHFKEVFEWKGDAARYDVDQYNKYIEYLSDHISWQIIKPDGTVSTESGRTVTLSDSDTADAKANLVFNGRLHPGEKIVIDYQVDFNENIYKDNPRAEDDLTHTVGTPGDKTNAESDGTQRSWMHREVTNQATLTTGSFSSQIGPVNGLDSNNQQAVITFNKTWLYKEVGQTARREPLKASHYIVVNEGQESDIGGWALTDNIASYNQEIISDIVITVDNGNSPTITIPLTELETGITTGAAAGSSTTYIKYTFPAGEHRYRFDYTTKDTSTTDESKSFECKNGAVLKESAATGNHTYGAYHHVTVPAWTAVKGFVSKDISAGTLTWRTSIGEGHVAQAGSVYYDFVGYKYTSEDGTEVKGSFGDGSTYHTIDLDAMNVVITRGYEGDEGNPLKKLKAGVDYDVYEQVLTDAGGIMNVNDDPVTVDECVQGFKIVFNKDIQGPIDITYTTKGQFTIKETFINKFYYYKDGVGQGHDYIYGWATTDYDPLGSINKQVEYVGADGRGKEKADEESPIIKWHLSVNQEKYDVGTLVVVDTIPEDVEFNLKRDLQVRWVEYANGHDTNSSGEARGSLDDIKGEYTGDRGAPYDTWPTTTAVNTDNKYFTATYDKVTRKLKIVLYDMSYKKMEFNVYTHPTLQALTSATEENPKEYENTASVHVYDKTQPDDIGALLGNHPAKASIWYKLIDKTCEYTTAPNAKYTVTVNPGGALLGNDDWLIVSDVPSPKANITINFGSITVTSRDTQLEEADDPVKGRNQYGMTVTEENPTAGSFELKVPNGMPITISYEAFVEGWKGSTPDLSNAVTLKTSGTKIVEKKYEETKAFILPSASTVGMNRITVRKFATGDGTLLDGAVFEIRDKGNGEVAGTMTSGEAERGVAKSFFSDASGASHNIPLETDKVYQLVEVQAPSGYRMGKDIEENLIKEFVFVTGGENDAENLIKGYKEQNIQVIYIGNYNFVFTADNEIIPNRSVSVIKEWLDVPDNATAARSATFHLLADGEDAKDIYGNEVADITLTGEMDEQGNPIWTGTWNMLPIYTDNSDTMKVVYSVKEVDRSPVYYIPVADEKTVAEDGTATIQNQYTPVGSLTLKGTKVLTGRAMTAADVFTFSVTEDGTSVTDSAITNSTTDGQISYPTISYTGLDAIGTYTYVVRETSEGGKGIAVDDTVYTVKVQVSDNGDGTLKAELLDGSADAEKLDFMNVYTASGEAAFKGTKTLVGRSMTSADRFSFEILENGQVIQTVSNAADGTIPFEKITYTQDTLGTHTYTVREKNSADPAITKDAREYAVTVVVTDNGDGTLKVTPSENSEKLDFANTYTATGSVTFEGIKALRGRDLKKDDVFTFQILEGSTVVGEAKNDEMGRIQYPEIKYTISGSDTDDLGTHTYTVKETSKDGNNITVDTRTYTVTVRVSDNGDGTLKTEASANAKKLDFVNVYTEPTPSPAPSVRPSVAPSDSPEESPSPSVSPSTSSSVSPSQSPAPSASPSVRPSTAPTASPRPTATPVRTASPTATPTAVPTATPRPTPVPTPTPTPVRRTGTTITTTATPTPETTSVIVTIRWDDNDDEQGLRPDKVTVRLSNGQTVTVTAQDGWTYTVEDLPILDEDGNEITYTWTQRVPLGYRQTGYEVVDNHTYFTNWIRTRGDAENPTPHSPWLDTPDESKARRRGKPTVILDDYDTPLGLGAIINHVGDCFE